MKSFRISQNVRVENKSVNTVDDLSLTFVLLFIESSDRLLSCTCYDLIFEFLLRYVLLYNATSAINFRLNEYRYVPDILWSITNSGPKWTEIPLIRNLRSYLICFFKIFRIIFNSSRLLYWNSSEKFQFSDFLDPLFVIFLISRPISSFIKRLLFYFHNLGLTYRKWWYNLDNYCEIKCRKINYIFILIHSYIANKMW